MTTKAPEKKDAPPPAPAHARKWTPEEFVNRQREALDNIKKQAEANAPAEARRETLAALGHINDAIADLARQVDGGSADGATKRELEELRAESKAIAERLAEQTERVIAERTAGGGASKLRIFKSDAAARAFALQTISYSSIGRELLTSNVALRTAHETLKRDLTGESGAGAGYALTELSKEIIGSVEKYTNVLEHCRVWPMGTAKVELRRRGTRLRWFRVGRGNPVPDSTKGDPTPFVLEPQEYGVLTFVHGELLADNDTMPLIGDLIAEDMADGIAQGLEDDVVNGVKGASHPGIEFEPGDAYDPGAYWMDGWLNHADVPTMPLESGVTYAAVTPNDLLNLQSALPERFHRRGPAYHFNRSMLFRLMGQQNSEGSYVWAPPTQGFPGTVWGMPYHTWTGMPAMGQSGSQAGKPFAAFGLMREAYVIGERRALRISESTHYRFPERLVGFLGTARYGGDVNDPQALVTLRTNAAA